MKKKVIGNKKGYGSILDFKRHQAFSNLPGPGVQARRSSQSPFLKLSLISWVLC
jgi:hypothetical protein